MSDKLKQLQQEKRTRLAIRDLYEQASPEARRCVMDLLRTDIDLTESLLEIGAGPEAGGGLICDRELPLGNYTDPGRYAWRLRLVTRIKPIPAKGRLGLWEWEYPADQVEAVR